MMARENTAKKREGRKPHVAADTAGKQPPKYEAVFVSGAGTDEDIAARCESDIPGWADLGPRGKAETVRLMRAMWERAEPPRYVVNKSEAGVSIGPDDPATQQVTRSMLRLMSSMGSNSHDYIDSRLNDVANYHSKADNRGLTTQRLASDLAFIAGGNATDTVQSSLLVQMAATHDAGMRALANIGKAELVDHAQLFGNLSAKLLGLYVRQAEALAKLQRGGEQVVKHVHIDNRGGQAVVTESIQTGGANSNAEQQPYAHGPALLGADPFGGGMPIASDQGQKALPDAWRKQPRRTEG